MRYLAMACCFIALTFIKSTAFSQCSTPTITVGSNPGVCNGTTSASLTYSATTNTPTTYSVSWSAAAIIAGFSNVSGVGLPASPIALTVPSNPGAGTYSGTLTVSNACGSTSTGNVISVTVNALPTITLGSNPSICNGVTSANLTYSATTNSPNQYGIAWGAAAIIAGFTNVSSTTSLPASPISITAPSNPGAGTYSGTLTVKNSTTGCSSMGNVMSVTVNAKPTITLGSNPNICNGVTSANLTYSATTSSPNQYGIAWGAAGIIAGFPNVSSTTSLPASPISITAPSNPGAGTYSGTLTVKNSTTGCSSTGNVMSVTVNAKPTITLGSNPSICNGVTSANLTYSATTNSPNQYSIAWGAPGIIAGFTNAGLTSLPASPISISTPSNPGAGSYSGTLTVKNATTGCSSTGNVMGVTVNALSIIATPSSQTQDVATSGNYTDASCNVISSVQPSGTNPVSGNITAKIWMEPGVPTYGGKPFVARHYEITPAVNATTATGTVTLYFLQSEFDAFNAAAGSGPYLPTGSADATGIANLRIGKYSGTSSDNSGLPGSYTNGAYVIDPVDANIVWNAAGNRWEVSFDVNGFSGFIAQTSQFVLPVTWVSFSAGKLNEKVLLKWQTTREDNSNHFDIEYSTDGKHFTGIGSVPAAGNSIDVVNYTFVHNTPGKENNYYRIVQVDNDGHKNYSVIRIINFNINSSVMILANPVHDGQLQVQFSKAVNIAIYDARGSLLMRQQRAAGSQAIDVSALPHGVYLLQVGKDARKFIIE